ncbi:ATP-dependent protease [Luteimonas yindakuii]|uniref:LON peptidase substrate-binding domain-containing protein n=1 Tax=Luteimonas yindakuii TaxID=2565782 RepID=UPI0011079738|nr:LON peptidase substrate-binding domain-containing protein [Luteimonas yindakuii]QCU72418.1 ATP-dependent protease [Luteimonas yindakuii]
MTPSDGIAPLPLFPLTSVLLPGAATALRIFEPRYLDLVRDCGRNGSGFGVCLILEGSETGAPALPAAVGTLAVIEDFDRGADGLLVLRVRGERRFRVRHTRVRDNGLVVADVTWLADDETVRPRPEHMLLAELLRRMLEHAVGDSVVRIPEHRFEDAAWVGWRLAELLPLAEPERQALLQEDDIHARLQQLLEHVA